MKFDLPSLSSKLIHTFRAFKYKNYRLYFIGLTISQTGIWMQTIALGWLIYRITGSPFILGLSSFATQIPIFLVSPFAGVLSDKFNLKKIIVITNILALIQALVLSILVFTEQIQVWQIILLNLFLGTSNAFNITAKFSFIIKMVDKKEDVANAIALNATIFNAARLIGPSIAGVLIALVGEELCFFINAICFVAPIITISLIKYEQKKVESVISNIFVEIKNGFKYSINNPMIKTIMMYVILVSFLCLPYTTMMPVFAKSVFNGNSQTLGFFFFFSGLGALFGGIYLAARKSVFYLFF